jgi:hypothetical protein
MNRILLYIAASLVLLTVFYFLISKDKVGKVSDFFKKPEKKIVFDKDKSKEDIEDSSGKQTETKTPIKA